MTAKWQVCFSTEFFQEKFRPPRGSILLPEFNRLLHSVALALSKPW